MNVLICVGSSCHLKGSESIVELMQEYIEKNKLENDVALGGSFCTGMCNRVGVTVQVDEEVHTGIVPEKFEEFFNEHILGKLKGENA